MKVLCEKYQNSFVVRALQVIFAEKKSFHKLVEISVTVHVEWNTDQFQYLTPIYHN